MLSYKTTLILLLVFVASVALAQDWQWERFEGDYRNPTGYPQVVECVGDFNGDGYDDIIYNYYSCRITLFDSTKTGFHWLPSIYTDQQLTTGNTNSIVYDLDGDGSDEIISCLLYSSVNDTVAVWKLISDDSWLFERHDELFPSELIEDLDYFLVTLAFGDLDSDGRTNAVFYLAAHNGDSTRISVWEQTDSGEWEEEMSFLGDFGYCHNLYLKDFDHDGDEDLLVSSYYNEMSYSFYTNYLFENVGGTLVEPIIINDPELSSVSVVGDFNGDGLIEFVSSERNGTGLKKLFYLDDQFHPVSLTNLTYYNGRILGNVATVSGDEVNIAGIRNWIVRHAPGIAFGSQLMKYTADGWEEMGQGYQCQGYVDLTSFIPGDYGHNPNFMQVRRFLDMNEMVTEWQLSKIKPSGFFDYGVVVPVPSPPYQGIERFYGNSDTLFSSPQFGEFNGSPSLEFVVIAEPDGEPPQIQIYESGWWGTDFEGFILRPDLMSGLPEQAEEIRTVDLDGDGISEIFVRRDSMYWSLFYKQGAHWLDYSDLLPDFESTDLGFADFDNNGTIDIFTDDDVWISLSPSPDAEENILSPLSFRLSCFPNPFNPATTLRFNLPEAGKVALEVFNIRGQLVETILDRPLTAGEYTFTFDGSKLPSGLYLAKLNTSSRQEVQKLILLK